MSLEWKDLLSVDCCWTGLAGSVVINFINPLNRYSMCALMRCSTLLTLWECENLNIYSWNSKWCEKCNFTSMQINAMACIKYCLKNLHFQKKWKRKLNVRIFCIVSNLLTKVWTSQYNIFFSIQIRLEQLVKSACQKDLDEFIATQKAILCRWKMGSLWLESNWF